MLSLNTFGVPFYLSRGRLARLAEKLEGLGPLVICLQEIQQKSYASMLTHRLSTITVVIGDAKIFRWKNQHRQVRQFTRLVERLPSEALIILCGDFNLPADIVPVKLAFKRALIGVS